MHHPTMEVAGIKPFEILVVDDSPDDIRLIRDGFSLWRRNRKVQAVMSGVEAFRFLRERHAQSESDMPELILLDWNLPGISGEDVLERLKQDQQLRRIPVVVFTSSSAPSDRRRATELGAERFITKPLDLDDFFNVIAGLEEFSNRDGIAQRPAKPN